MTEAHSELESCRRELEASKAREKNDHDRMQQLEEQNCHLKTEVEHLSKDNQHQEHMVMEMQKRLEHAAKEVDEKAEKEM